MAQGKQLSLFHPNKFNNTLFPSTRFQGSKRKLIDWIQDSVADLEFDTVLDVFGGTASVSHRFKQMGKQVTYNDSLAFNWSIGFALIENSQVKLSPEDVKTILTRHNDVSYPEFISQTFHDIYFTDEENSWLDYVIYNIEHLLENPFKQALARFALFQACIIKRPYNLFHRANLYMRNAEVVRSFGNKVTWDTPFEVHFRSFVNEANNAIFDNERDNKALNIDAFETPAGADLVYLDPPYLNSRGIGVDYRDFYHFLEGMMNYPQWAEIIDWHSKHKRLSRLPSVWTNTNTILDAFDILIERHRNSSIIISYRDNGIPSQEQIIDVLKAHKAQIIQARLPKQYALAKYKSHELLLIAT